MVLIIQNKLLLFVYVATAPYNEFTSLARHLEKMYTYDEQWSICSEHAQEIKCAPGHAICQK